jgi:hypothetical protein
MRSCSSWTGSLQEQADLAVTYPSINKAITLLAQVLEVAVEYELISRNPAKGRRRRLKADRPAPVWLDSAEQIAALLDQARHEARRGLQGEAKGACRGEGAWLRRPYRRRRRSSASATFLAPALPTRRRGSVGGRPTPYGPGPVSPCSLDERHVACSFLLVIFFHPRWFFWACTGL